MKSEASVLGASLKFGVGEKRMQVIFMTKGAEFPENLSGRGHRREGQYLAWKGRDKKLEIFMRNCSRPGMRGLPRMVNCSRTLAHLDSSMSRRLFFYTLLGYSRLVRNPPSASGAAECGLISEAS